YRAWRVVLRQRLFSSLRGAELQLSTSLVLSNRRDVGWTRRVAAVVAADANRMGVCRKLFFKTTAGGYGGARTGRAGLGHRRISAVCTGNFQSVRAADASRHGGDGLESATAGYRPDTSSTFTVYGVCRVLGGFRICRGRLTGRKIGFCLGAMVPALGYGCLVVSDTGHRPG